MQTLLIKTFTQKSDMHKDFNDRHFEKQTTWNWILQVISKPYFFDFDKILA